MCYPERRRSPRHPVIAGDNAAVRVGVRHLARGIARVDAGVHEVEVDGAIGLTTAFGSPAWSGSG